MPAAGPGSAGLREGSPVEGFDVVARPVVVAGVLVLRPPCLAAWRLFWNLRALMSAHGCARQETQHIPDLDASGGHAQLDR